jgi:hypothetical protein
MRWLVQVAFDANDFAALPGLQVELERAVAAEVEAADAWQPVLCSFNSEWKVGPTAFAVWLQVPLACAHRPESWIWGTFIGK